MQWTCLLRSWWSLRLSISLWLTFGIGVAIQTERAAVRGIRVEMFLARRFLILLAFGLLHMLLISNVDILSLYAVCGILLIPLLRVPTAILAVLAFAAVYLPSVLSAGLPPASSWQAHAAAATRIYGHGGFGDILMFRWRETQQLILPLLVGSAQKTFGLMLLGLSVWRSGIFQAPQRRRLLLWTVCIAGGLTGAINTAADVSSEVALSTASVTTLVSGAGISRSSRVRVRSGTIDLATGGPICKMDGADSSHGADGFDKLPRAIHHFCWFVLWLWVWIVRTAVHGAGGRGWRCHLRGAISL